MGIIMMTIQKMMHFCTTLASSRTIGIGNVNRWDRTALD